MEAHYLSFPEKQPITEEANFDVDSFKVNFPNLEMQFLLWDWAPFIETPSPYFLELVRELYASYRARQDLLKHKGKVNNIPYLSSMFVRGKEVYATAATNDQYAWITGIIAEGQPLWAIMKGGIHHQDLKFEARMWLDLTERVFDLAIKRDKDASTFKKTMLNSGPSDSSIPNVSEDSPV
ncbi:hypothetical protein HAX54_002865 [Datura stramonium]|uniref:Uncharacterized protein n=1 Tax=Datura stramonium TaxID=4076 RepID=A0ABS8T4I2_DATST|nr:hypothetical protein [Datura stramonium]